MDISISIGSSQDADHFGEISISNADVENDQTEEDEPVVHVTIRALSGGTRDLGRVRFRSVSQLN